jgi:hypothetical protein
MSTTSGNSAWQTIPLSPFLAEARKNVPVVASFVSPVHNPHIWPPQQSSSGNSMSLMEQHPAFLIFHAVTRLSLAVTAVGMACVTSPADNRPGSLSNAGGASKGELLKTGRLNHWLFWAIITTAPFLGHLERASVQPQCGISTKLP